MNNTNLSFNNPLLPFLGRLHCPPLSPSFVFLPPLSSSLSFLGLSFLVSSRVEICAQASHSYSLFFHFSLPPPSHSFASFSFATNVLLPIPHRLRHYFRPSSLAFIFLFIPHIFSRFIPHLPFSLFFFDFTCHFHYTLHLLSFIILFV